MAASFKEPRPPQTQTCMQPRVINCLLMINIDENIGDQANFYQKCPQ